MTETMTQINFEALLKEREKAKRMERKWQNKISELTRIINENCIHTLTETVSEYEEGGYYVQAQYHTIKRCIICKKELGRKTVAGSYQ